MYHRELEEINSSSSFRFSFRFPNDRISISPDLEERDDLPLHAKNGRAKIIQTMRRRMAKQPNTPLDRQVPKMTGKSGKPGWLLRVLPDAAHLIRVDEIRTMRHRVSEG